jgi:VWFA-related protein
MAVCCGGRLAAAQAAPAVAPTARFEEATEVFSVEVPVTVVGRDGRPVRGLKREQFVILDEGRAQTLTDFRVVDLEDESWRTAVVPGGPVRGDSLRSSERRHFFFLFDLSFATPSAILKARLAARDFVLTRLHPADLAAVATVSLEQGARLIVTFTPDRAQLARGIDTLGAIAPGELSAGSLDPLRFLVAPPASATASPPPSVGAGDPRGEREALVIDYLNTLGQQLERTQKLFDRSRVSAMTRTLGQLAASLAAVKGRKHVVLFSEGFDSRLLLGREGGAPEEEQDQAEIAAGRFWTVDNDNRYGSTELQGSLARMLEEFRGADCVIEAVDIGGLRAPTDASESAPRGGREALFVMANGTGGTLFEGANDLSAQLERLMSRTMVTYVLAFERSDARAAGVRRRLDVRVTGLPPGAKVAHRSGYDTPRPFRDLPPLERSLLTSDEIASAAPRRDLDLALLATSFRQGGEGAYVPVIIEIAGESLPKPAPNGRLDLEIYGYVSDEVGQMRDFFARVVAVEIQAGDGTVRRLGGGIKYYGHFELPRGRYLVRVLVRDPSSGRTGVASLPLEVPPPDGVGEFLLPPFFLQAPGRWLLVREPEGAADGQVVYPFVIGGEPFVPAVRPRLHAGDSVHLALFAYRLSRPPESLDSMVRDRAGAAVRSGSLRITEATPAGGEGVDKILAEFDSSGLAPGDYTLEVSIRSGEARNAASPRVSFSVAADTPGGTSP